MNQGLSIVIPALNEEQNIPKLLEELNHFFENQNYEIIVIDDFSDKKRASVKLSSPGLRMINFRAEDNVFDTGAPPSKMPTVYREVGVRSKGLLDAQDTKKLPEIEAELVSRFKKFEEEGTVKMPFPYKIVTAQKI